MVMTLTKMPWHMRRSDFVPFGETLIYSNENLPYPKDGSEAELHRVTTLRRQLQTQPSVFNVFPVGTWSITAKDDTLRQLRCLPIVDLLLRDTTYPQTVQKYVGWNRARHKAPPIRVVEVGNALRVVDGHHRVQAAIACGQTHVEAWVSPSLSYPALYGNSFDGATYPALVAMALKNEMVDTHIIRDAFEMRFGVFFDHIRATIATRLSGFEGYISPTEIETLRKWGVIYAKHNGREYFISLTGLGQFIVSQCREGVRNVE